MKKFKVVDLCCGKEVLGYANDLHGVKQIARQRVDETDGECGCFYYPLDEKSGKYLFEERKFIECC